MYHKYIDFFFLNMLCRPPPNLTIPTNTENITNNQLPSLRKPSSTTHISTESQCQFITNFMNFMLVLLCLDY